MTSPGMLLGRDAIYRRREEIFVGGCFEVASLRAAAYDLRVNADGDIKHTGKIDKHKTVPVLNLNQGQLAVLETLETLRMPWDLAANIGVKHRMGIKGLFVSPGLFVDPGFGWDEDESGALLAPGARLRFMVTNVGRDTVPIRLGPDGDHVLGIQFMPVDPPAAKDRKPVQPVPIDPQGLAFFDELTKMSQKFERVEKVVDKTATATEYAIVGGVFVVLITLFSAFMGVILSVLASGEAAETLVDELNDLDASKPFTGAIVVAIFLVATALVVLAAVQTTSYLVRKVRHDHD